VGRPNVPNNSSDFVEEGKGGNQDYFFVRSVWRWLLEADEELYHTYVSSEQLNPRDLSRGKKVVIFSDGAGQHFKQKKTISFWVELQES